MPDIELRLRKGTSAENDAFAGAEAEVTADTELAELRLHDGASAGGRVLSPRRIRSDDGQEYVTLAAGAGQLGQGGAEVAGWDGAGLLADALNERSAGAGVTVDGVLCKDGAVNLGDADLAVYDEGTWTPTLGATVDDGSHSYSVQIGEYTRVGNLVMAYFVVNTNSIDATISGNLLVRGLPFTARATSSFLPPLPLFTRFVDVDTAGGYLTAIARISNNSTNVALFEIGDNVAHTNLTEADLPAAAVQFAGVAVYWI